MISEFTRGFNAHHEQFFAIKDIMVKKTLNLNCRSELSEESKKSGSFLMLTKTFNIKYMN